MIKKTSDFEGSIDNISTETLDPLKGKGSTEVLTNVIVVKRDGSLVPFRKERIVRAITLAFRDTKKILEDQPLTEQLTLEIERITHRVMTQLLKLASKGTSLTVEGIQDLVEITLMKMGHHDVARDYIIYRDQHKKLRDDSVLHLKIHRKDGSLVRFNPIKISSSLEEAFQQSIRNGNEDSINILEAVTSLTKKVVQQVKELYDTGKDVHISTIQDQIELLLMEEGYFYVAKTYILLRALKHTSISQVTEPFLKEEPGFTVITSDGKSRTFKERYLKDRVEFACRELTEVSANDLFENIVLNFYPGIKEHEVDLAMIMTARTKIEIEPSYSKVAARLLADTIYRETIEMSAMDPSLETTHQNYFATYIKLGISTHHLNPALLEFDLDKLSKAIDIKRDDLFSYLGLQTLYDRYFIHHQGRRIETPQIFWMRVAMGIALVEGDQKNERAIEFYHLLSQFLFTSSTPTLFNSGTRHSQLSSCYLSTIMDDLSHIFKVISDDAQLSKWAGGIGNDWTNVRATGSLIKGTNGKSQGIIPFLKVANDTAVAVNQGGKRKGAMCAYLETWHLDIEDFLELRKNTGDERRRTHDMNTANWIPDLFMKRVSQNSYWTLFSPDDVSDLHDLYGKAFEERYLHYEQMTELGNIKLYKRLQAVDLWRKMLSMLFETGHPWITFKDPSNIRSPQDHVGVVHSSNLCTEILLPTSALETAVCNLGSVNLSLHCTEKGLDEKKLASTIQTAIRMLDNVIDINFYPTIEARESNLKHRPIGLGMMGFQDCLYKQNISFASHKAIEFADQSAEMFSYYAILSSAELAKERGKYPTYAGSKWDRGLLPIDTLDLLSLHREAPYLEIDRTMKMNWEPVRNAVKTYGMRNSNTMAIAPTATISNIVGVVQSIEPSYKHLFVKSNLSGEFTIPNIYLVDELKKLGLWDQEMLDDLKYFDGSIAEIERIPSFLKQIYLTAFEIDPEWLIECASRRQKWLDMGQSLNLYIAEASGKKLNNMYMKAWTSGLKTTYYLRSVAATQIEKSTTDINKRGIQPRWMKSKSASSNIQINRDPVDKSFASKRSCQIGDESCESCQ